MRIGFVGELNVGKTTIAAMVADRLRKETSVHLLGDATSLVPMNDSESRDGIVESWTIHDAAAGVEEFDRIGDHLDVAYIVTTPDQLESARAYARVADAAELDSFTIVNRFREIDRERIKAFDGPPLAECFPQSHAIRTAMAEDEVPTLNGWTVETVVIEALQPTSVDFSEGIAALVAGTDSYVNIEVIDEGDAGRIVQNVRERGYDAAYYRCNCNCHDGHVLATAPAPIGPEGMH